MPTTPNDVLTEIVEQYESLEEEREQLKSQQNALIERLHAQGFPKPYVRKVIARRKKEREVVLAEDEAIRSFEDQLGMRTL